MNLDVLAECVKMLTKARDRIARDGHVPGDEEGCEHCETLLHIDRVLVLARAEVAKHKRTNKRKP